MKSYKEHLLQETSTNNELTELNINIASQSAVNELKKSTMIINGALKKADNFLNDREIKQIFNDMTPEEIMKKVIKPIHQEVVKAKQEIRKIAKVFGTEV